MAKNRPPRFSEIEARKKAFSAARAMLADRDLSQLDAAERAGVHSTSVGAAQLILQHGTPDEIAAAERGDLSLSDRAATIRRRVPMAERAAKRRHVVITATTKNIRDAEMEVWAILKTALDGLTSLPSPKDTAVIVRKNNMRVEAVNRKLLAAIAWITEFENEITR